MDVAFVCGWPYYVEGYDKLGLELLAAPKIGGKTVYYSYIIVKKDSDITNFEELIREIKKYLESK
ncbi:MAG: PhnD/SsuA/transferrin family substrate-binding protein [Candidatus Omnitrophica bacterium]|nr:PhnD/SsuA/transferrin family substrate-binding protein [Candidatus Omnitrophota bacterium]